MNFDTCFNVLPKDELFSKTENVLDLISISDKVEIIMSLEDFITIFMYDGVNTDVGMTEKVMLETIKHLGTISTMMVTHLLDGMMEYLTHDKESSNYLIVGNVKFHPYQENSIGDVTLCYTKAGRCNRWN